MQLWGVMVRQLLILFVKVQLTLEHAFELRSSTYTWIFQLACTVQTCDSSCPLSSLLMVSPDIFLLNLQVRPA